MRVLWIAVLVMSVGTALAVDRSSSEVPAAEDRQRVLPLQGGVNFRDLGGYLTQDGRRVRWGMLYRSGTMSELTEADYRYLSKLNIAVLADLRSTEERLREPTRWPAGVATPRRLERDYTLDIAELVTAIRVTPSPETARVALSSFYRNVPQKYSGQYRQMFDEMLAGNTPLAFHCSAGKDRTGVAAALILTALGVPRDVVTADYLLSNAYYQPKASSRRSEDDPAARLFAGLSPDIIRVFTRVEPEFLDAAFAGMIEQYGSVDAYFEQVIDLTAAERQSLRRRYTEPVAP